MGKKISIFEKVADAKGDNPPYQKGTRCIERIDRIKFGYNRQELPFVAFEKTVILVTSDARGTPYGDPGYQGDLEGDCVSQVFSMKGDQKTYTMSELRRFLKNVVDVSEEDLNDPKEVNRIVLQICGVDDEGEDTGEQPLQNVFIERKDYVKAGKAQDGKAPKDFINTRYIRCVPASEVMELLDEDQIARLFPAGLLEKLVEAEEAVEEE